MESIPGKASHGNQKEKVLAMGKQLSRRISEGDVTSKLKKDARDLSIPIYRRMAARIITSQRFELFVGSIFATNLVFIIMETDAEALYTSTKNEEDRASWIQAVNWYFLFFYCLELALRAYVERCMFVRVPSNVFDVFVVSADLAFQIIQAEVDTEGLPSLSVLRIVRFFRLVRLARALMNFSALRELYVMIHGLKAATRAIFWATVLIFIVLILCSIVAVQVLHPLNEELARGGIYKDCDRCDRAFSSVAQSTLTFVQQIIAGDSWGLISIPIIERHPWTLPIFIGVLLCINLGLMNLVLTAIVDQASASRENDTALRMREKAESFKENKARLIKVFQELDTDGDGLVSYEELTEGYKNEEARRIWDMMDVEADELSLVYDLMDDDGSGNVNYTEFIEQIHQMQTRDQRILVMLLTASVHRTSDHLRKDMKELRDMINQLSQKGRCASDVPEINGQMTADPSEVCLDAAASLRSNALASDSSPQVAANHATALDRLAKSIEEDVLASLRDFGRMLEKELAATARNSDLLAMLTRSLSSNPAKDAADKARRFSSGSILDGCTPIRSRGEPLPRMMDKGAPSSQPVDQRINVTSLSNANGSVSAAGFTTTTAKTELGRRSSPIRNSNAKE